MTKKPKEVNDKELIEQAKTEVKKDKENTMKTSNQTLKTAITVVITLVAVSALVGMFYLGTQFQDGINHNVASQVKELATVTSKQ